MRPGLSLPEQPLSRVTLFFLFENDVLELLY